MSWIDDCLQQQRKSHAVKHTEQITEDRPEGVPAWESTWKKVRDGIKNDVLEFNHARGPQFQVSWSDWIIQVIPKQEPIDTAVLEIDQKTGTMKLTCPISHSGLPRRGEFKAVNGSIICQGEFVGQPKPPNRAITPEEFVEFILKPLLFPDLK
jgi:hypothetical protein